jgi:hypothetical protein
VISEILNAAFRDAILMVRVDATKRESLLAVLGSLPELLGGNNSIVTVIMLYCDIVGEGKMLESKLGFEGIIARG